MDQYNKIEGQEGIYEVRKMKLMYEVIPLESSFCKKNLDTREIEIINRKMEESKDVI